MSAVNLRLEFGDLPYARRRTRRCRGALIPNLRQLGYHCRMPHALYGAVRTAHPDSQALPRRAADPDPIGVTEYRFSPCKPPVPRNDVAIYFIDCPPGTTVPGLYPNRSENIALPCCARAQLSRAAGASGSRRTSSIATTVTRLFCAVHQDPVFFVRSPRLAAARCADVIHRLIQGIMPIARPGRRFGIGRPCCRT